MKKLFYILIVTGFIFTIAQSVFSIGPPEILEIEIPAEETHLCVVHYLEDMAMAQDAFTECVARKGELCLSEFQRVRSVAQSELRGCITPIIIRE